MHLFAIVARRALLRGRTASGLNVVMSGCGCGGESGQRDGRGRDLHTAMGGDGLQAPLAPPHALPFSHLLTLSCICGGRTPLFDFAVNCPGHNADSEMSRYSAVKFYETPTFNVPSSSTVAQLRPKRTS